MRRQVVRGLYTIHIPELGLSLIKNMVKALREESGKIRTVLTWKTEEPVRGSFSSP